MPIATLPPLPYRALTDGNPEELGYRVTEALGAGYITYGELDHLTKLTDSYSTVFFQLVIDPKRVRFTETFEYKKIRIVTGGTDRAFCEKVSDLLENEGWILYGQPKLYLEGTSFQMLQRLVQN